MSRTRRVVLDRGISLIETLIALLLLSFIAIGLLPMMTRSVQQNTQAGSYTTSTNWVRSTIEEFAQLPFNSARLTIAPGNTDLTTVELWEPATSTWVNAITPVNPGNPTDLESNPWQRTTTVEQYNQGDIVDNGVLDTPLVGGSPIDFIHFKRIRVRIERQANRALDRIPPITFDYVKVF